MADARSVAYVRTQAAPVLPPPALSDGALGWLRANLFSGPFSAIFTVLAVAFIAWVAPGLIRYLFIDAVWTANDGASCRSPEVGACWAYIGQKLPFFMYGSYPREWVWRVNMTLVVGAALIVWLLAPKAPAKQIGAFLFFVVYPLLGFILLSGWEKIGLPKIDTDVWGGVFVSLLVSAVGIVVSLPIGILLALGRRSDMPTVKLFSVLFIEFVRGVPLVTVLFMASVMLPLFVPEQYSPDKLLRALIGIAMFASAYMAEVVRAGLQAIPKGQFEGAMAVGLGYWQMMRLIVLPQALKITIPNIVNTYIGLFKDTTLVFIVGIFDLLHTIEVSRIDPKWATPVTSTTGYAVAGIFYLVFCYAMSRYARATEARLAKSERR